MKFRILSSGYNLKRQYSDKLKDFNLAQKEDKFYIEINSLEELEKLQQAVKYALIIDFTNDLCGEPNIEIYDDYRE